MAEKFSEAYKRLHKRCVRKEKHDRLVALVLRMVEGEKEAMKEAKEFALRAYMGEEENG